MAHQILLISDNCLTRWGISQLVASVRDVQVSWECELSPKAVSMVRDLGPDFVILDIADQGYTALGLGRDICRQIGGRRLLVLTPTAHDRQLREVLDMDVGAYVSTSDNLGELTAAVDAIVHGKRYFSSSIDSRLESGHGHEDAASNEKTRSELLSRREQQVLRLIAQGLSKKLIAEHLELSVKTVDNHATSLMNKLDIHDRVGLARYAFREGLAEP
jgi:DNA-binding NarL/FixJ family response regulator